MAKLLFRLAQWCYTHNKRVIAAWVLLLAALGAAAATWQKGFSDVFEITGMPTTHATAMLLEKFPNMKNPATSASVNVVFRAPDGHTLDEPTSMAAINRTVEHIRADVPNMGNNQLLGNPVTLNAQLSRELTRQLTAQGLPEETARADAHNLSVLSPDRRIGVAQFDYDVPLPADVTSADRAAVLDAIQYSRDAGLQVEVGGPGFGDPITVEPISEAAGLIVALVILLILFRSILAAAFPLVTAVVGVGVGALATLGATAWLPLNSMTPTLGLMLGLAVGIDYALFILARYRDELRAGRERIDAVGLAVGTAGSAVIFAGVTVVVALLGMRVAGIAFLSYMGYAAALTVFVSVLVALTFLPALLGLCGRRVFRSVETTRAVASEHATAAADYARAAAPESADPATGSTAASATGAPEDTPSATTKTTTRHISIPNPLTIGARWVKLLRRAPAITFAILVAFLLACAYPALDLQLALPSDKTANIDSTQRKSAELLEQGFGPGRNAPILVVVDATNVHQDAPALRGLIAAQNNNTAPGVQTPANAAQLASFIYTVDAMNANTDVQHAQLVGQSADATAAQILVTPRTGPADPRTVQLIHALRQQQLEVQAETGVDIGITGLTPIQLDVTDKLSTAMPIYLALVVGLALLLLMMIFRSLLVPLIAAGGFLLSVGAAFGVTVLVWQKGVLGLWDSPGPLISFIPIFLIGVTFGLAMDYQVFIVSRMRERYVQQRRAVRRTSAVVVEESVQSGFGLGGGVVTVAALIMVGVFASFVFQPLPFIQIFGFALGAGVLFDAFLIRMTIIPALMVLGGRATWYMPRWLNRIIPRVDVEGAALERAFERGELSLEAGSSGGVIT